MLWRKDRYVLYMLASKETVLHLTTLSTEQEQKLNAPCLMCIKLIYSEAEKHLLAIGPPLFLRCLDGEQTNLKHISAVIILQVMQDWCKF